MKKYSKRKIFRIVWFTFAALFIIYNWSTFQSRNLPGDTFQSNTSVSVTKSKDKYTFKPLQGDASPEIIFFQGGATDPKAYAPLCRKIAENGFTCHLIRMSWRMPQFDYKKIMDLFDLEKGEYIIGGHSQGGKMAAQFVYENPGVMKGLFLIGTSHPRDIDLSNIAIPCIKLYAENDGLASTEEVIASKTRLPKDAQLVLIKGGNHSQFGYLGKLLMDKSASISLDDQQQQTLENLIHFIKRTNKNKLVTSGVTRL